MSKTKREPFSDPVVKALFSRAANHCPICKIAITELPEKTGDKIAVIGQIAHINSISTDGPRGSGNLTKSELNSYDNLIVLCANCHLKCDRQELKYTVNDLKKIKEDHEKNNERIYQQHMPAVSFRELDAITAWLITKGKNLLPDDVTLPIPPRDKINKNQLSDSTSNKIRLALLKADEVRSFVNNKLKSDSMFADKLRFGFVERYAQLRQQGFQGDDLFHGMQQFACKSSSSYDEQCAGLAVLSYLFESCDVFEK